MLVRILAVQVTLVVGGGCVPAKSRVHPKRVKRETCNMSVDFMSDT